MIRILFFIFFLVSTAYAAPEICGDGRDNDNSGVFGSCPVGEVNAMCGTGCDKLCDTNRIDADGDGYGVDGLAPWGAGKLAGKDCDDTDIQIYPGAPTIKGCAVGNFRTCQTDGTYSVCSPLSTFCPAGCSICRYFNKNTGNNSNPGTFASPWRDYLMFTSYYSGGDEPPGYFNITAGSTACFIETGGATYSDTYNYNGETRGLTIRNKNCGSGRCKVIGLPGTRFNIDLPGTVGSPIAATTVWASNNWEFINFKLSGNYTASGAFATDDSLSGLKIENACIQNNSTIRGSNGSGIQLNAVTTNTELNLVVLEDNFDPILNTDNQNIIIFRAENLKMWAIQSGYSTFVRNTNGSTFTRGDGIKFKHANPTSSFTLLGSNIQNAGTGIMTGAGNHTIRYNNFDTVNWAYGTLDVGGPTFQVGTKLFSNNTITNGAYTFIDVNKGWNLAGTPASDICTGDVVITPWVFENNLIVDNIASYGGDTNFIKISPYGPDVLFTDVSPTKLIYNTSCMFNPITALSMGKFSSNNGNLTCSGRGILGATYNFTDWQAQTHDTTSFNTNPLLDLDRRSTIGTCASFGFRTLSQINGPINRFNYQRRTKIKF